MSTTTSNRDYRIPESTDSVNIAEIISNLGDDVDADVQAIVDDDLTVATDTSPGAAASGFTATVAQVSTALNGSLVELVLEVTNTSAITATSGNITDTTIYTLDAAYRPTTRKSFSWQNGTVGGQGILQADGTVVLTTASDSIGASTSIKMQLSYFTT